ncbi:unnamed protein product [Durusdinium trenchii]|uniref:Uncharacterized protein n=1 Tax=Durusdinium trenchii TaxID=1381693 RepID=A0ABP0M9A2_9DINO
MPPSIAPSKVSNGQQPSVKPSKGVPRPSCKPGATTQSDQSDVPHPLRGPYGDHTATLHTADDGPQPGPSWTRQDWDSKHQPTSASAAWISVPEDSTLVLQGYVETGPVVQHEAENQDLLSDSNGILYGLAGEAFDNITFQHDHDWSQFPEATWGNESGNEHKEPLGAYEEDVQEEEEQNDGKCQGEHQSGEAEVPQETDEAIDDLLSKAKAGAVEAQVADIESPKVEEFEESKDPQAEAAEEFEDVEAEGEEEAYYPPAKRMRQKEPKREELKEPKEPKEPLKRETPHWLFVEELPDLLQGLQQETLVLASDGTQRRGMYNQADKALTAMLGDLSDEIVCHDDPNWQKFPQVGEEIKNLSDEEECLCVATLPPRRLWGVGVATKSQVRQKAAKLALAALIAFQMTESGEEIPDLSRTTAVADFLEEARAAKDDLWQSTLGDRA